MRYIIVFLLFFYTSASIARNSDSACNVTIHEIKYSTYETSYLSLNLEDENGNRLKGSNNFGFKFKIDSGNLFKNTRYAFNTDKKVCVEWDYYSDRWEITKLTY